VFLNSPPWRGSPEGTGVGKTLFLVHILHLKAHTPLSPLKRGIKSF